MASGESVQAMDTGDFSKVRGIHGFYVLSDKGLLGTIDNYGKFLVDTTLTEAFYAYSRKFIEQHLAAGISEETLLGWVISNDGSRKWQSPTILFTDELIRGLYKSRGDKKTELTPFQRRQKYNSIYRGMEILLEYRLEADPGLSVFCPLLFDRRTTLAQYQLEGDETESPDPRDLPVIEVVNFIKYIESPQKNIKAINYLLRSIHGSCIDKSLRKPTELQLLGETASKPSDIAPSQAPAPKEMQDPVAIAGVQSGCLGESPGEDEQGLEKIGKLQSEGRFQSNPLFEKLYQDLMEDKLMLPTLPDVAIRIRRTLQGGLTDMGAIAKVIETDPAITAKVIRSSNSPLYRGSAKISTCSGAIVRLGLKTTQQLVLTFAVRDLFKAKTQGLKERMQTLWNSSIDVAAICYVLGSITPNFDPESSLLAGLLHHLGEVPIISYADDYPEFANDPLRLDEVIRELRHHVGDVMLHRWGFSEEMVTVVAECDDWHRDPSPAADLTDLVLIAQLHYYVNNPSSEERPPMNEVPAFRKLALGKLSPSLSLEIINEAKDQIEEVKQLLVA